MAQHHIHPGGRYPVLRTIAILWLVSAFLAFLGGVYQAIVALLDLRGLEVMQIGGSVWSGRVMAFFIWLAATFFVVILNVAIAELIKLMIDLEHNTRSALSTVAAPPPPVVRGVNGSREEESAEAALIKGH